MRHADAATPAGTPDHERPLSARGEKDARAMGRWLRNNVPGITEIRCSTALRARRTCELVVTELEQPPTPSFDAGLYHADHEDLLDVARTAGGDGVLLLIGHNPAVSTAADALTDEPLAGFPAGGVALFEFVDSGCHLVTFASP